MTARKTGLPWWQPLCLWALLALLPPAAPAGAYVHVDSFTWSEPVSIRAALNDWQGAFRGGEEQFTYDWLEAGVTRGAWGVGLLYRYDYALRFSPDTAEFYHRDRNDLPVDPERRWDLRLSAQHFVARGLRLSTARRARPGLRWRAGLSLLQADDLIDGHIRGTDRQARVDYFYSEDALFHRQVAPPDGLGLSLDLAVDWQATARLALHGEAVDLPGAIWWRDAPFTDVTANADRRVEETDGIPALAPLVSGREGLRRRWRQGLSPRALLRADYRLRGGLGARLALRRMNGRWRGGLGARWAAGDGRLSLDWWPALGLWQAGWSSPRVTLALGADRADDEAHALRLRLSLRY